MNWLKKLQIVVLVILVFFGTTGITVYHHICACSTHLAQTTSPCCEPVDEPSCCETVTVELPPSPEAAHQGCGHDHNGCKDIPLYFQASLLGLPVVQKAPFQIHLPEFNINLASVFHSPVQEEIIAITPSQPDPPPLPSGRNLVYSLHQPKIPFSS